MKNLFLFLLIASPGILWAQSESPYRKVSKNDVPLAVASMMVTDSIYIIDKPVPSTQKHKYEYDPQFLNDGKRMGENRYAMYKPHFEEMEDKVIRHYLEVNPASEKKVVFRQGGNQPQVELYTFTKPVQYTVYTNDGKEVLAKSSTSENLLTLEGVKGCFRVVLSNEYKTVSGSGCR